MENDVERFLDELPAHIRSVADAVRSVIQREVPEAVEKRHGGWKIIGYSVDGSMPTSICAIAPHREHVNLQFFDGTALPDPGGLLEGTGKRARHVKLRSPGDAGQPEVAALVREAAWFAREAAES